MNNNKLKLPLPFWDDQANFTTMYCGTHFVGCGNQVSPTM